ncbi:hypothetical protein GGE65_007773 [Skermanella aerolata]|uniref:DUF3300 domain-containing protein n=1 Tax=Skermanella aerolata TaxID=393310 RepID=UPI003D1DBB6F
MATVQAQNADPSATTTSTTAFSGSDLDLSSQQLAVLVGPIALYPDDLLALVLPASTQPLQVVEAQRLLDQRKSNSKVQPPKTWDPSVVALLNYPEAVAQLNRDLTWTQQLGTSVINQQAAVMDAIQSFRKAVLEAGNLKSDDKQNVTVQNQTIYVQPANPQVIYVPAYNPTTVVYAPAPGFAPYPYYSPPYPYYYDPAAAFFTGAVFGAAVGFALGWDDHGIYHGDVDINVNRNINVNNVENRINRIDRNRENVWRPQKTASDGHRTGSSRATAKVGSTRASTVDSAQIRAGLSNHRGQPAVSDRSRTGLRHPETHARQSTAARQDRSRDLRGFHAANEGAFSGIDRADAASRFSSRGSHSLGSAGGRMGHFHGRR